jgi:DNA-binding transcriptional ArsR family regulator
MELHEEPAPPSQLAERVDTSLQNAQYHLGNLKDAGAVEVIDTAYSEKGREMDVYAPADRPLVIFAGGEEQSRGLRQALTDLLTGVGAVALGAVVVQELFGRSVTTLAADLGGGTDGASGGGGGPAAATPTETPGAGAATPNGSTATPTPSGDAVAETTATGTQVGGGTPTPAGTPTPEATGTPVATEAPTHTDTVIEVATPTATEAAAETARAAGEAGGGLGLPPGLLFFLGGLVALLVVVTVAYYR